MNTWLSGPAALVCAETLRQNGYEGRLIMVTKDSLPPFDKPKLSKVWDEWSKLTCTSICVFWKGFASFLGSERGQQ